MYDFFAATGARNSPMFLNFRPFKLDLSPVLETDQLIAGLSADVKAKRAAQEEAIKSLPIPEWDGNSPDLVYPVETATAARQKMIDRLNSGLNPFWVAKNDEEFRRAQSEYAAVTSPVTQKKLLEEKKDKEFMQEILTSRKDENATAMTVFDERGMAVVDPLTPDRTITAGDWVYRRENIWNAWDRTVPVQAQSAVVPSIKAFDETLKDTFSNIGSSSWGTNVDGNKESWGRLLQASNNPAELVVGEIIMNSEGKSNQANLMSALEASMSRLSPQHMATLQQMYMQSPEYSQRMSKDPKAFMTDGKFDPAKLYNATFADASFTPSIGKKPVTFAQKVMLDRVATMLVNENKVKAELIKAGGSDGAGGGGDLTNREVQIFAAARAGMPKDQTTGQPLGREIPLPVAVGSRVAGKPVTVMAQSKGYVIPFSGEAIDAAREAIGLTDEKLAAGGVPLMQAFTTGEVYTLNGSKIPMEALKNATLVSDLPNELIYTPYFWGNQDLANPATAREAASGFGIGFGARMDGNEFVEGPPNELGDGGTQYRPMMKVKVQIPGEYIKDWAPSGAVEAVNRSSSYRLGAMPRGGSSSGYALVNTEPVPDPVRVWSESASDVSRNYVEQVPVNHRVFDKSKEVETNWEMIGDNTTTIEVLVDVDRSFEYITDKRAFIKAYMLQEYGQAGRQQQMQEQAQKAGQQGAELNSAQYQQVISPYILAPR